MSGCFLPINECYSAPEMNKAITTHLSRPSTFLMLFNYRLFLLHHILLLLSLCLCVHLCECVWIICRIS